MSSSIAKERMNILLSQAKKKYEDGEEDLTSRYIDLINRISERNQTQIPRGISRKICSKCKSYLKIGENCRVRLKSNENLITYTCTECGAEFSYGYE